jgi:hypothetical protein
MRAEQGALQGLAGAHGLCIYLLKVLRRVSQVAHTAQVS